MKPIFIQHQTRSARYRPLAQSPLLAKIDDEVVTVASLSETGLGCRITSARPPALQGTWLPHLSLVPVESSGELDLGPARVVRVEASGPPESGEYFIGLEFEREQPQVIDLLRQQLADEPPGHGLLRKHHEAEGPDSTRQTLDQFVDLPHADLFAKCRNFQTWIEGMRESELYQRFYRLEVQGPIDHHVRVKDFRGYTKELTCFDSNSYLGLHLHPEVIEEVERVTRAVGFGTPSAQMLCGTNEHLVGLEEDLAAFHHRQAAMVFPSGFSANIGILRALLRSGDAVFRDQHAHASIHEGCRKSGAEKSKVFAHNDVAYLDRLLTQADRNESGGKLVVTDGVFSMHGELAPLLDLAAVCRKHRARLMVDDAHGVGVIGPNGRGIEEHFNAVGVTDVLMGTLSKTLGALGGYVVGDQELIDYLRWYAPSGLFTTTLPAPICAGVRKALELIVTEPEHRERLWSNIHRFVPPLAEAGFKMSGITSPIVTVFVGQQETLWKVSRDLYDAGIKAGNVIYPAVPRDGCILRFTMNARHSDVDIDSAVDTLIVIGKRYGLI